MLSLLHDPDHRHRAPIGVMGNNATTMRDPLFYRWHDYINYLFQLYKHKLLPYTKDQLGYDGINIGNVIVQSERPYQGGENPEPNEFHTFWKIDTVDLQKAFVPNICVTFTHLKCASFCYAIEVNNTTDSVKKGMCRIFIAPHFDEKNLPMSSYKDQPALMCELDKFPVTR